MLNTAIERISYEAEPCAKQQNDVKVGLEWCDITEHIQRSCQVLALGELVHDPYFCLGEAMAAVEFMEARMDLNMRGASSFPPLLTAHEALETAPARLLAAVRSDRRARSCFAVCSLPHFIERHWKTTTAP